jgi:hypothetical protein
LKDQDLELEQLDGEKQKVNFFFSFLIVPEEDEEEEEVSLKRSVRDLFKK